MKSTRYLIGSVAVLVVSVSAGVVPLSARVAPSASAIWRARPAAQYEAASLSCMSVSDCWTVGDPPFGNAKPVVERWNGSYWSAPRTIPLPQGGKSGFLRSIRCLSDRFCVAVGSRFEFNTVPFTAIWNGKSWSSKVPISGTSGHLDDVDCVSTTNCVAVGDGHDGPLAIHWNGRSWSRDTLPSTLILAAVSCSSASNCVAVGPDETLRFAPSIARWNGRVWTSEAAQLPPGTSKAYLSDVSCPAQNDCYAVGRSALDNGHRYMQHWDGSRWSIVNTPAPPRGADDYDSFSALTCTVQVCTVTGYVGSSVKAPNTLFVDRGAGSHWAVESTPSPQGAAEFGDVACPSATTCYAIGGALVYGSNQPNLFEERN